MDGGPSPKWTVGEPRAIDERSSGSPALASWDGYLHLAWIGRDARLNTMWSADGHHFAGKHTWSRKSVLYQGTGAGSHPVYPKPSLVATPAGLLLGWTEKGRPTLMSLSPTLTAPETLPEKTGSSTRLAPASTQVLLAWAGSDTQLNVRYGWPGAFGPTAQLDARSQASPSLCVLGDQVVAAWKGTDARLNLAVLRGHTFDRHVVLDQSLGEPPAICAIGPGLVMAWSDGVRGTLCTRTITAELRPGPVTPSDESSPHPPTLATHRGELLVAWTGSDRHINVARLQPSGHAPG